MKKQVLKIELNNFFIRTLTGIVFASVIIGSLLMHPYAFVTLMLIFSLLALMEYKRIFFKNISVLLVIIYLLTGTIIYSLIVSISLFGLNEIFLYGILAFILILLLVFYVINNKGLQPLVKQLYNIVSAFLYISLPFALMSFLYDFNSENLYNLIIGVFILMWIFDSFAYITGTLIGKHKMAIKISPKKTWEGLIGGAIFCFTTAYILSLFLKVEVLQTKFLLVYWLIIALIVVVMGTIGDLFESKLKRKAGIKDTAILLPGHGGILDRFDSLLFVIPSIVVLLLVL